ncbi:MAG TPA: penicillin-binding protein 2 [Fimbriimonas sp.]|nr:penicillin-binding protein 2 [Fimbriimonas sp.]
MPETTEEKMARHNEEGIEARQRRPRDRRGAYSNLAVMALFVVAAASQAKLQTFEKNSTIALANKSKRYELSQADPAHRGSIYSSDGQPLAKDENVFDLNVDFTKCPNTEAFWMDLGQAAEIPATEFSTIASSGVKSRVWPQAITDSEKMAVDQVRARWRADGVSAVSTGYRTYPLGSAASCLVGVIRRRSVEVTQQGRMWQQAVREYGAPRPGAPAVADQLTGLEEAEDSLLRGRDGIQTGVTDRSGRFLPMRVESTTVRQDGKDVTLTIDSGLQAIAAQQVKKTVEENAAVSGVAIVEDPKTGNILAMANYPTFEPYTPDGNYASLGEHGGLNQAYMSTMEPGSMFKILTLAKALDEGVVHMTDHFYCPGEKVVVPGAKPIRCDLHAGNRAMGDLDPVLAIARSCNIWAATWGREIGYDKFVSYLESLDLLRKPSLELPGEVNNLFNRHDPARELQVANVGFGQSINCTPLSLVSAFSTLANGGVHLQPRLIDKIGGQPAPNLPGKRVLTSGACDNVIKGMIAVIEHPHGTGKTLRIPGYELAGKTGTAQKMARNDHGHVSNFVGFVPAINPKAVILVMINKPQKGVYYGATVAGPVFRELAKAVIRKYRIPPTLPIVPLKEVPAAATPADEEADEPVAAAPTPPHRRDKTAGQQAAAIEDRPVLKRTSKPRRRPVLSVDDSQDVD